jgi:hypothetical protein
MPDDVPADGSIARARSLGAELVAVHQWLRAELVRIRDNAGSLAGEGPAPLQAHCLAFCQALTSHHASEDSTAFAALGAAFPDLADVLEPLRQDHRLIAGVVGQLNEILSSLTPENSGQLLRELDGLTATLESHFQWEERRLVNALDALDPPLPAADLFGPEGVSEDGPPITS